MQSIEPGLWQKHLGVASVDETARMTVLLRLMMRLGLLAVVLLAPLTVLTAQTSILHVDESGQADAALIFGALVRGGQISPLHADQSRWPHPERLDPADIPP